MNKYSQYYHQKPFTKTTIYKETLLETHLKQTYLVVDVITLVLWSSDVDFEKKEHIVNIRKIGPSYVKSTTSKKRGFIYIFITVT